MPADRYQAYLSAFKASDAPQVKFYTPEQYAALSTKDQQEALNLANGYTSAQGPIDPRVTSSSALGETFSGLFGQAPGAWTGNQPGQWKSGDPKGQGLLSIPTKPPSGQLFDPSRVYQDPNTGMYLVEAANYRPDQIAQRQDADQRSGISNQAWPYVAASVLGGGMAIGAASGAATPFSAAAGSGTGATAGTGQAAGTGAFDMGGSAGVFDSFGNPLYGAGPEAAAGTGAFDTSGTTPSLYGGAGSTPAPFDASLVDTSPISYTNPAGGNSYGLTSQDGLLSGAGTGGSSGSGSGLLDQATNWVTQNPLRALGLLNMARGLIPGSQGTTGASSGSGSPSSKSGGGTGLAKDVSRPAFQQNPYLAAQLQRGGYQ